MRYTADLDGTETDADLVTIHEALRIIAATPPAATYGGRKGICAGAHLRPESVGFRKVAGGVRVEFWPNQGGSLSDIRIRRLGGRLAAEALRLIDR